MMDSTRKYCASECLTEKLWSSPKAQMRRRVTIFFLRLGIEECVEVEIRTKLNLVGTGDPVDFGERQVCDRLCMGAACC